MKKFFFVSLVSIVILANTHATTVQGCAIDSGDPWYSVEADIISNPLSDVLDISISSNAELVTFTNKGLTSDLYIASKDTDGKYPGYDQTLKDYRPLEGILGHNFDPNVKISVENNIPQSVSIFYGGWGHADIGHAGTDTPDSGTATLARVLDSTDNYITKQVVSHERPADVAIPEPDHQTMYAFYQGARYDIEIVLNYSLNNNYSSVQELCGDPGSNHSGGLNTTQIQSWFISSLIASVLLAIVAYSTFTAIKLRSRSKNKKQIKRSKK